MRGEGTNGELWVRAAVPRKSCSRTRRACARRLPALPPPGRGMPHALWEVADYFEIGRTLKTGVKTSFPSFESCIILRTDMSKLLDYNPLSVCFVIE